MEIKKRMIQIVIVLFAAMLLCALCVDDHLEREAEKEGALRTVGGEEDITYGLKGRILSKEKNSVLKVRIEDVYMETNPFEESEIYINCSGDHRWAYEKSSEGQLVAFSFHHFSFRQYEMNQNILQVGDIYPADAEYAETLYLQDSFTIDYNDMNAVVGDADYVFVGDVLGGSFATYGDSVFVKNGEGESLEVREPYTDYHVTVVENIKGNLTMQDNIRIRKQGGLTKNGVKCCLFEGDVYPMEGERYIFIAYVQEDGSLLLRGPVSNIPLEINGNRTDSDMSNVITYEDIMYAYQNQIDSGRKRTISMYEEE